MAEVDVVDAWPNPGLNENGGRGGGDLDSGSGTAVGFESGSRAGKTNGGFGGGAGMETSKCFRL